MITYILLLFFYTDNYSSVGTMSTAVIPGFVKFDECTAAGNTAKLLEKDAPKKIKFACLTQSVVKP